MDIRLTRKKKTMINLEDKESDLDLDLDLSQDEDLDQESFSEKLQRTEQWQEERRGNWTGSAIKELMSCGRSGGSKSWTDELKHLDFGKNSIKYIFANAMERKTGRYIQGPTTAEMIYGTITEPLSYRRANEELKKKGLMLKKVGFQTFPGIPTAGVSSDAVIVKIDEPETIVASGEIKACTSWGTYFDRTFEGTHDKSKDFWQTQAQMVAWDVDKTLYIVLSPPKNFRKYINKETVEDLYDDWVSETEMHIEEIKRSDIHVQNMLKRISIGERVIFKYLETQNNIAEILDDEVSKGRTRILEGLQVDADFDEEEVSEFEKAIAQQVEQDEAANGFVSVDPGWDQVEEKQEKVINKSGLTPDLFDDSPF